MRGEVEVSGVLDVVAVAVVSIVFVVGGNALPEIRHPVDGMPPRDVPAEYRVSLRVVAVTPYRMEQPSSPLLPSPPLLFLLLRVGGIVVVVIVEPAQFLRQLAQLGLRVLVPFGVHHEGEAHLPRAGIDPHLRVTEQPLPGVLPVRRRADVRGCPGQQFDRPVHARVMHAAFRYADDVVGVARVQPHDASRRSRPQGFGRDRELRLGPPSGHGGRHDDAVEYVVRVVVPLPVVVVASSIAPPAAGGADDVPPHGRAREVEPGGRHDVDFRDAIVAHASRAGAEVGTRDGGRCALSLLLLLLLSQPLSIQ